MHSHFDLKKSHFDSRNHVPDVLYLSAARCIKYFLQQESI
jgi:hypothetical protein